jgi:hypothetical protein
LKTRIISISRSVTSGAKGSITGLTIDESKLKERR